VTPEAFTASASGRFERTFAVDILLGDHLRFDALSRELPLLDSRR